ncbi:hypothetical protein AWC04_18205, partial [Mycolicibacterium fallax]
MSRLVVGLILGCTIASGVLWPLALALDSKTSESAAEDPVVLTDYRGDFRVEGDGTLLATETITAQFPAFPARHGLFRYWDIGNPNDTRLRHEPRIESITVDGAPAQHEDFYEKGRRFLVAKIGDPHSTMTPGPHVYQLRYRIEGVLTPAGLGAGRDFAGSTGDPAAGQSSFYWNVVAPAWNNRIEHARVSVTVPGPVLGAQCSIGTGVGRACTDLSIDGQTVTLQADELAAHTPVTVRLGVEAPAPPQVRVPWSVMWDPILGRSPVLLVVVLGVTALGALAGWAAVRLTVEPPPGFPLQYAPPAGLGPVQCEIIRTEAVPPTALTGALFWLAERGLVRLERLNDDDWRVTGTPGPDGWGVTTPIGQAVISALELDRAPGRFTADGSVRAGAKLTEARTAADKAAREWAFNSGLMVRRRGEWWVRASNVLALVIGILAATRLFLPATIWVLPFAAYFLFSAPGWRPGVGSRRTAEGRRLWSMTEGFHRVLATDSAESRFDFAARRDLYASYLPYAVAGGVAAAWAAKYRQFTGQLPPDPPWVHSAGHRHSNFAAGSFQDSFDSALSSSISAYSATQSSSSSSSGGGGGGGGGAG